NRDGGLSADELQKSPLRNRAERLVQSADSDGDGRLSYAEAKRYDIPPNLLANSRAGEHFMPDLDNPESPGELIDPEFFLTGQKLRGGLSDDRRRRAAASVITHNEWFAKAAVNRVFTQLTGEGFYFPVDDIGPDREVRLEKALEALAKGFEENDHDLRWLIEAITRTDLYAGAIGADAPTFTAARPIRLRARQIFLSVAHVAGGGDYEQGLENFSRAGRGRRSRPSLYGGVDPRSPVERLMEATFSYDPSTSQEELNGDVPQALALMNGQLTSGLSSSTGPLGRLLYDNPSDVHAVRALYRLILVREPTDREREIAVSYVKDAAARATGFEDLAWALFNGAEFVTRR
ncbi:MAG: DUF1553 domain-containing protein, partial [Planctomycetota bacterium]